MPLEWVWPLQSSLCPCCHGTGQMTLPCDALVYKVPEEKTWWATFKTNIEFVINLTAGTISHNLAHEYEHNSEPSGRPVLGSSVQCMGEIPETDEYFIALEKTLDPPTVLTSKVFGTHGYIPVCDTPASAVQALLEAVPKLRNYDQMGEKPYGVYHIARERNDGDFYIKRDPHNMSKGRLFFPLLMSGGCEDDLNKEWQHVQDANRWWRGSWGPHPRAWKVTLLNDSNMPLARRKPELALA